MGDFTTELIIELGDGALPGGEDEFALHRFSKAIADASDNGKMWLFHGDSYDHLVLLHPLMEAMGTPIKPVGDFSKSEFVFVPNELCGVLAYDLAAFGPRLARDPSPCLDLCREEVEKMRAFMQGASESKKHPLLKLFSAVTIPSPDDLHCLWQAASPEGYHPGDYPPETLPVIEAHGSTSLITNLLQSFGYIKAMAGYLDQAHKNDSALLCIIY